jgi:hypothetical protein
VSPTYRFEPRFARELGRLTRRQRADADRARDQLVDALRHKPPRFPPALRVKRVQGHEAVWEL